eukprot:scaffold6227_cov67-Phaeocystis_antarctica.AAC.1
MGLTSLMGPESVSAPREGKPSAREGRTGLGEQRAPLYARRRVITERATGPLQSNGSKTGCNAPGGAPRAWGRGRHRQAEEGLCRRMRRGPTCAHSESRACFAQCPSNYRDKHGSLHRDVGH